MLRSITSADHICIGTELPQRSGTLRANGQSRNLEPCYEVRRGVRKINAPPLDLCLSVEALRRSASKIRGERPQQSCAGDSLGTSQPERAKIGDASGDRILSFG